MDVLPGDFQRRAEKVEKIMQQKRGDVQPCSNPILPGKNKAGDTRNVKKKKIKMTSPL